MMYSQSFHLLSSLPSSFSSSPLRTQLFSGGVWYGSQGLQRVNFDMRGRCSELSQTYTNEYVEVMHKNGEVAMISGLEIMEEKIKELKPKVKMTRIETIRNMLRSMEDGEINISAYDTAWVALVKNVNGSGEPQFPSALEWISNNQLPDGSWGDSLVFSAHDRILNTLACIVALKSWNIHPDKAAKGLKFFKENLDKLEDENAEHMPCGFEVVFPSLLELAKKLDIDIQEDSLVVQQICQYKKLKLEKIPKDIMHKMPTPLLYSLEGMPDLDWDKLLKLQFENGSFLFSPSSTAYALMQTQDKKCLTYLNNIVQRFSGGVPNVYPVDLFEHVWVVDRLQRLGISRFFEQELKECMNYVARYWIEDGMCWARNSRCHDVDDSSMGFRMLRLYGYNVSTDVFKQFKKDDTFVCIPGQSTQAITGLYNLLRASHVLFPGEKILDEARDFCTNFLREKQDANAVFDKWIIAKDLAGEVAYALDVPWYASLPRVEARFYIEQYGGGDDVWIGKVLYRMLYVNNNEYLELAKVDYNTCQALHCVEWVDFQKWYEECKLENFGVGKSELLLAYYVCAASIFEPERAKERIAWAKTSVLLLAIDSYFKNKSIAEREDFVNQFKYGVPTPTVANGSGRNLEDQKQKLVDIVLQTLDDISVEAFMVHGANISQTLRRAWKKWMANWEKEGDIHQEKAELILQTINLLTIPEEFLDYNFRYERFFQLINRICHQLGHFNKNKVHDQIKYTTPEIESNMQELAQLVLHNSSDGLDFNFKQKLFTVVKSFYYTAFFDPKTIEYHMSKVLFDKVY